jgi:hypothetical protein
MTYNEFLPVLHQWIEKPGTLKFRAPLFCKKSNDHVLYRDTPLTLWHAHNGYATMIKDLSRGLLLYAPSVISAIRSLSKPGYHTAVIPEVITALTPIPAPSALLLCTHEPPDPGTVHTVTIGHFHSLERRARWHVKLHPKGIKSHYKEQPRILSHHANWMVGNGYSSGLSEQAEALNTLRLAYGLGPLGEITLADGTPLSVIRNLAALAAAS